MIPLIFFVVVCLFFSAIYYVGSSKNDNQFFSRMTKIGSIGCSMLILAKLSKYLLLQYPIVFFTLVIFFVFFNYIIVRKV